MTDGWVSAGEFDVQGHAVATFKLAQTVLAAQAASITFGSIPQTFEHLQVVYLGRSVTVASREKLRIQFNGDTAANYDDQMAWGAGGTGGAHASGQTGGEAGDIAAANAEANVAAQGSIFIPGYARTTFHKTWQVLEGVIAVSATDWLVAMASGRWHSTAAITSITLFPNGGNFDVGTVISLYGIA